MLLGAALLGLCAWVGPPKGDLANYLTAAAIWREGGSEALAGAWDYRAFTGAAAGLGYGDQLVGFPVLPPTSALLGWPLLLLGLRGATWGWWASQALLALALGIVASRSVGRPAWLGIAAVLLTGPCLVSHLQQGQLHLPAVLALAAGLWALRAGRTGLAGLGVGLAVGLKIHAWPLLPALWLLGERRAARFALGTILAGGALSVGILGWAPHRVWLGEIAPAAAAGHFIQPWHLGLGSLGAALRAGLSAHPGLNPHPLWVHPELAEGLARGIFVLAVGLSLAVARRGPGGRVVAIAAIVALAVGALLARYHLLLVLPAAVVGVDDLWRSGRRRRAAAVAALMVAAWWAPGSDRWEGLLDLILGIPRFWCLAAAWGLLMPWGAIRPLGAGLAVGLSIWTGWVAARPVEIPAGWHRLDHPEMPLVAAELIATDDGALWFSGLPTSRQGLQGRGWVGYRLIPEEGVPQIVASDPAAHVWRPVVTGPSTVEWTHGPAAGVPGGREAVDPARGRIWFLSDLGVGVRAQRLWWRPMGETTP